MAVLISVDNGCLLDHNRAVSAAYEVCILPNDVDSQHTFHTQKGNVEFRNYIPIAGRKTPQKSHAKVSNQDSCESQCTTSNYGIDTLGDTKTDVSNSKPMGNTIADSICDYRTEAGKKQMTMSTLTTGIHENSADFNSFWAKPVFAGDKTDLRTCTSSDQNNLEFSQVKSQTEDLRYPDRMFSKRMSLRLKPGFFATVLPYMMDSQLEKISSFMQDDTVNCNGGRIDSTDLQRVLLDKRKRKKAKNRTNSFEKLQNLLIDIHSSLIQNGREQGIFLQTIPLPLDNNTLARQCALLDHCRDVFTNFLMNEDGTSVFHMGDGLEPLVISNDGRTKFSAEELIHRRVIHETSEACIVDVAGTNYVLPSFSKFLLSNLQDFCDHLYIELTGGYDLIVLDPPWENKSVKRKKSYDTIKEDELHDIPIKKLARPDCLVALWVTNNDRIEDYSLSTLFPAWGLTAVARWLWMKVTQTGDLITSIDDDHKKPFETLLLGRYFSKDATATKLKQLPEKKVLISVPCSLHSKKPPLAEYFTYEDKYSLQPAFIFIFSRNQRSAASIPSYQSSLSGAICTQLMARLDQLGKRGPETSKPIVL